MEAQYVRFIGPFCPPPCTLQVFDQKNTASILLKIFEKSIFFREYLTGRLKKIPD
jgi:hypothetical protein